MQIGEICDCGVREKERQKDSRRLENGSSRTNS